MAKDYYAILEVPRDCDAESLKSAYRRLAHKWHPDHNPTNVAEAQTKFQEIGEAYGVLRDPKQRRAYDQIDETPPPSGPSPEEACKGFFDDDDLFDHFFEIPKAAPQPTGKISCTLEELFNGVVKSVEITRFVNGRSQKSHLTVEINRGSKDGEIIIIPGKGDRKTGCPPQNLALLIKQEKHRNFEREGDDLIVNQRISLWQALIGFTVNVIGIDQEEVVCQIEEIVRPGWEKRIEGKGMPRVSGGRGDLIFRFQVVLPAKLTLDQSKVIRAIASSQRDAS
jgi:DnaJ-class molecular chaperone